MSHDINQELRCAHCGSGRGRLIQADGDLDCDPQVLGVLYRCSDCNCISGLCVSNVEGHLSVTTCPSHGDGDGAPIN